MPYSPELLLRVERIAYLSRIAQLSPNATDQIEAGYELCYWISELTWGAENLYPPEVARELVRGFPSLIKPVLWPEERVYRGLDIGFAAGVTVVWPLDNKGKYYELLKHDCDFSWKEVGPHCLSDQQTSPYIYVDNVVNLLGSLDAQLGPRDSLLGDFDYSEQVNKVMHDLAAHIGEYLPKFRFPTLSEPPRPGEVFPKIFASIDERGAEHAILSAKRTRHKHFGLTDGQRLVRVFGFEPSPTPIDCEGWSKFVLEIEHVALSKGASRKRTKGARTFAEATGKCTSLKKVTET